MKVEIKIPTMGESVVEAIVSSILKPTGTAVKADEEILELTYITALYDMHAVMSRALHLEYDDRPEPIVEVEAPEGFTSFDVGAAISVPEPT